MFKDCKEATGDVVLRNINGTGVTNPVAHTVANGKLINTNPR